MSDNNITSSSGYLKANTPTKKEPAAATVKNEFANLTPEGQEIIFGITSQNPSVGQAASRGIYDVETGLISDDLAFLEQIMLEGEDSGVKMYSEDNGYTRVEIDEDGDGIAEQSVLYDKGGIKAQENIDRNQDGNEEAIIYYDEAGDVEKIKVFSQETGEWEYIESYKDLDDMDLNTVHEKESNGRETLIQYTDGKRTYTQVDYEGDNKIDYQSGNYIPVGDEHGSSDIQSKTNKKSTNNKPSN